MVLAALAVLLLNTKEGDATTNAPAVILLRNARRDDCDCRVGVDVSGRGEGGAKALVTFQQLLHPQNKNSQIFASVINFSI